MDERPRKRSRNAAGTTLTLSGFRAAKLARCDAMRELRRGKQFLRFSLLSTANKQTSDEVRQGNRENGSQERISTFPILILGASHCPISDNKPISVRLAVHDVGSTVTSSLPSLLAEGESANAVYRLPSACTSLLAVTSRSHEK
jgi:hypothetical protein